MTQPNLLSFEDKLLFGRPFQYESTFTMEDCERRLWTLNQPRAGFFESFSSTADISNRYNRLSFEIRYHRRSRMGGYTTSQAFGDVTEGENGKRVVKGYVRFGLYYFLLAIFLPFLILFIAALSSANNFACLFLFGIILTIYMWFTLISDYRKLNETMRTLFH